MRFMVMVKGDKSTEDGSLPAPKLFVTVEQMNEAIRRGGTRG